MLRYQSSLEFSLEIDEPRFFQYIFVYKDQ